MRRLERTAPARPTRSTTAPDPVGGVPAFGGPKGGFSTVFGLLARRNSVGPFDPLYPNDTMLSNGVVDTGDAPMPAAQIDVTIAENSGAPTDISGVGYLDPQLKSESHSRDGLGHADAHNYDEPFYFQYIPATARPTDADRLRRTAAWAVLRPAASTARSTPTASTASGGTAPLRTRTGSSHTDELPPER